MSKTLSYKLSPGPLLSAISPGQTGALVTTTPSGLVNAIRPLCNLHQTAVHLSADRSSTVLLILGTLRKGVLITPDAKDLKRVFFLFPGSGRLTSSSLLVKHNDTHVTITERATQKTLSINYKDIVITPPPNPTNLRLLLHAINKLSHQTDIHETTSRQQDALITSYNTFLSSPPVLSNPRITTTPTTQTLVTPPPITGKTVFLEITASPVPKNWFIRCTITKNHPTRSSLQDHPKTSVAAVVTLPLNDTVSFPIVLSSHSPVKASFHLIFQHEEIPVSSTLLDILDYSQPAREGDEDTSHHTLGGVNKLLNPDIKKPGMTSIRLPLPLPRSKLHLQEGVFKTALNGIYKITASEGVHNTTTVTIQGAYHIVPFVRAALLRRVLKSDLTPITINGAISIRNWKRAIVDGINEWLPSFRRAETALVDVRRVYERVQQGCIEECYGKGEQIVYRDAVVTARASYGMLRRSFDNLWTG